MKIETRELTKRDWPVIEALFGANGACAGCWCMWWRLDEGEKFQTVHGAPLKKRFRALVQSGRAHGILAFADGAPIGWCSFDARRDYPRLDRSKKFACDDADEVWSIPCFFIKAGFRGQGVAKALLAAALKALKARGATIVETYPIAPSRKLGNAEAYTGVPALFEPHGFELVQLRTKKRPTSGRLRMRLHL